ncbi:MAG TPA: hypothetical protein VFY85_16050 [Gemmatimonadaceae bacterium]|nr:hypothetical protein [Gemmatimonadaceae bacterium]
MSNHDREPRRPLPNERELRHEVLGHGREPARVLQWLGFFLAPAVFFAHLQIAYVMIPWGCTVQNELWQHVVGFIAVVLSLAGVAAAWIARARTPEAGAQPPGHPVEGPGALFRTRFLGDTGLGMSAVITLILLMQWIAGFFISVCQ